jgi:DNA-binding beta-propeller fold protein YncE
MSTATFVTPDGKYLIAGSISKKLLTVIDLSTDSIAWEHQFDKGVRPMAIETNPYGSTKRIFVQLSDTDGFAVIDFAKREEVARITLPDRHTGIELNAGEAAGPSHGIGVSPDGKTLWVTSIPQNAIFAYSLPDLRLVGPTPPSVAATCPTARSAKSSLAAGSLREPIRRDRREEGRSGKYAISPFRLPACPAPP